jgi:hypothetical protein
MTGELTRETGMEERIFGLLMGLAIGTVIGFFLHVSERRRGSAAAR